MSNSALLAADLVEASIPEAAAVDPVRFGWDGAYIGVSAGYGWLEDVTSTPIGPIPDEGDDWVFGAHAGYLWQFGSFVIGPEIEAMRLDTDFELASFITVENAFVPKVRAGFAMDRFLFTGHLGTVYVHTNDFLPGGQKLKDWGLAVGAGIDYAVTDNIVVGAQYTHYNFEEFDSQPIDAQFDSVTARFGYKF